MHRRSFLATLPAGLGAAARLGASEADLPVTGREVPPLAAFDELMRGIVRRQGLPGGSLSLARDGRLVYARAFGWAWVEGRVPARPETLFGLASVSKALTGVAILRLVDQGRLGLDDRACALLRDIAPPPGRRVDPRTGSITIRQLLNHSAGFTEQPDKEEIARRLGVPASRLREDDLVRDFLGRRLGYDPGTRQKYSNFGFAVLGAVVARVVGRPYEAAVRHLVFRPMGIRRARVGHGGPHRPDTARPYGGDGRPLPAIDVAGGSSGGWIVATVEMARFLAAIHTPIGGAGRPFLSEDARRAMLAPPPPPLEAPEGGPWMGLGWDVVRRTPRGPSYLKNGGMPGARAVIGHTPGGVDWAVAFNGGRDVPGHPGVDPEATRLLREAIGRVSAWPEDDQFPAFDRPAP